MNRRWKHHRPLFPSPPLSARRSAPPIRWRVLPIIWLALKRTCTAIGAMVLISLFMGVFTAMSVVNQAAPALPDEMVLYIGFEDGIRELPQEASFADPFSVGEPTLRELVSALDRAKNDPRVKGLYARINGGSFALASVQELRAAVKRFKESGKFAYVYAPSYGEGGNGLGGYYLASAFDELWMQTMGVVSINGLNAEIPFFRAVMDKIGIYPNFFQRKEYKSAYESLTNNEMSPANRESTQQLIDDIRTEFLRDIPPERGMSALKFRQLVDKGLFTADEAVKAGLVTEASYADILVDKISVEVLGSVVDNEDLFVDVGAYIADTRSHETPHNPLASQKPEVALVYVVGTIMGSNGGTGAVAAADEIAPAILEAGDDERIEAVVVRVDSPGGSPSASESILRALEKVQRKGKPVIVSMGSTAASGGYWVASYADRIFASPTTITGSIGVVGGKFAAGDLWEKLGVNWENVSWGENSGMWSINHPFSKSEAERINAMLDQVYDGFIKRVAWGRNMTEEQVDAIAKGRVWSGAQALKNGLADEEGGLNEALDYTAQLLGGVDQHDVTVVVMPKPKSAFEQFMELIGSNGSMVHILEQNKAVMDFVEPLAAKMNVIQNADPVMTYETLRVQ